jgi:hypothetical protein
MDVTYDTKITMTDAHLKMLGLQLLKIATIDQSAGNQDHDLFATMLNKVESDYKAAGLNDLMEYDAYDEGFKVYGTLLENVSAHLRPALI